VFAPLLRYRYVFFTLPFSRVLDVMMPNRTVALQEEIKQKQRTLAQMLAGTAPPPPTPPWKRPKTLSPAGGQQRIANASVTPPATVWGWTCVPGNCQPGNATPCGMMHPPTHRQCFRCGSVAPHIKKAAKPVLPAPVATAPLETPAAMDVDTIPDLTHDEKAVADVKQPLDDLIMRYTIKGPDVSSLFRKMEATISDPVVPDEDGVNTLLDQIDVKVKQLQEAREDQLASQAYSLNIQSMTAGHLKKVETEHNELTALLMRKKPSLTAPDTFAKADKQRSAAVENFEKWTTASMAKQKAISDEVETAETAADEAIAALQAQKLEIKSTYDKHAAAWTARNRAIQVGHQEKIASLEKQCHDLSPSKSTNAAGHDIMGSSTAPSVIALQEALAEAQGLLAAQKEVMGAAELRYQAMEARIASFLSSAPSGISGEANVVEGPAHSATDGLEHSAASNVSMPTSRGSVDDDHLKGKGKGKVKGHEIY
jgi:hypothetical protein